MSEQANFDDLRLGCIIIIEDGEAASPLPLEETRVSGQIIGPVASIQVTQQFSNPFKTPIEIAYLFPLPHDAAIVDYLFTIGARQIRADMKVSRLHAAPIRKLRKRVNGRACWNNSDLICTGFK
jgi:hypothetical protein